MAIKISFLRIAEQDLTEAFVWYEQRQSGLGDDFMSEIDKAIDLIKQIPEGFPQKFQSLRVIVVDRFPYGLFYKIEDDGNIRIYACLHLKRNLSHILKNR